MSTPSEQIRRYRGSPQGGGQVPLSVAEAQLVALADLVDAVHALAEAVKAKPVSATGHLTADDIYAMTHRSYTRG